MTLGEELWALIEKAQGYAYISDAVEEMTDEEVLKIAEDAIVSAKLVVKLLEVFLVLHSMKPGPSEDGIIAGHIFLKGIVVGLERSILEAFRENLATNAVSRDSGDYPMERGVRKL